MNAYQNTYADGQYAPSSRQYGPSSGNEYRQYESRQNSRPSPGPYGQTDRGYYQSPQDTHGSAPAAQSQRYYSHDPQDWNGGYDQYHPQDRYQEVPPPQRQFSYEQSPVEQPRTYHYDERYHNRDARGPTQDSRTATAHGATSPNRSRPGTSASNRSKMKRERILDDNPAPKAMAWDNPFGVFPGTKKDIEAKKKEEEKARKNAETPSQLPPSDSTHQSPASAEQPSKHHGQPQPSAHTRDLQSPLHRPTQYDAPLSPTDSTAQFQRTLGNVSRDMPPPQSRSRAQNFPSQTAELPVRPAPSRNDTASTQGRTDEPSLHRGALGYGEQSRGPPSRDANTSYDSQKYNIPSPQDHGIHEMDGGPFLPPQNNFEHRRPSDPTWSRQKSNQAAQPPEDAHSYGGVPRTTTASSPLGNVAMPNFAAMTPGKTEDVEKEITLQRKPVYQKRTYQAPPATAATVSESLKSPLSEFSFDLPQTSDSPAQTSPPNDGPSIQHQQPRSLNDNHLVSSPHGYVQGGGPGSYSQPPSESFPPRSGSMTQSPREQAPSFKHPYNQPPQRDQPPGHAPLPRTDTFSSMNHISPYQETPRNGSGGGYDRQPQQGIQSQDQYGNPVNGRNQNAYGASNRDQYYPHNGHEGYDEGYQQHDPSQYPQNGSGHPRYQDYNDSAYGQHDPNQYQQNNSSHSRPQDQYGAGYGQYVPDDSRQQQPFPRPRTAPGTRLPQQPPPVPQGAGSVTRVGALTGSDAAHPIPVRPGLNQPAPSPASIPTPVPQQTGLAQQDNLPLATGKPRRKADQKEAPVTIAELNNLREMFKNNPNNHGLGLKFAKRLVEAAKVLANEGGRADPKKTAQNRERYIFDAHKVVKKLVSAGSAEAMFYLADCYGQGLLGLESDPREAFNLYNSAAKLGHAQSAYRVAVCCELGQQGGGGTRRDHLKAVQYYKRAATMGDPPAMYKMGMIQLKGLLGQVPNPREGITWLKRAADRADEDNPHALFELGLLYESAKPTDTIVKDEAYARQLFYQAAELGYKYSQHRLGSAFEYGLLGCPIDARQSIAWYTMAAKQGEHQSEFALSGWYLTGSPPLLEQNDQEAYLWARKAASSGLAKAEYAMGYYTEVGIGTNPDIEEAKRWYYRAAAQHHPKAKERLDELKRGGPKMQKTRVSRSNVGSQNEGECTVM